MERGFDNEEENEDEDEDADADEDDLVGCSRGSQR